MPRTTSYAERPQYGDAEYRAFIGRIKLRMFQLELTQSDLARAIGIDHAAISGWLSLKYKPSWNALPPLIKALKCDGHWLLMGEGSPDKRTLSAEEGNYQGAALALQDVSNAVERILLQWQERARRKRPTASESGRG